MEEQSRPQAVINNEFYDSLGDSWYSAYDHPVALLRAENAVRTPWIIQEIKQRIGDTANVLDVGCGAGLLTNELALNGFKTTGIDLSDSSLQVAQKFDVSRKVSYQHANAYALPFQDESFDVVCAMDILEHVYMPHQLIHEASRVLRSGGLFFFHTFNRTFLSYLLVIKGVEWFVKNCPPNMHVYPLFITPEELKAMCNVENLKVEKLQGLEPVLWNKALLQLLMTKTVPSDFQFKFSSSLSTGYCGIAKKS